MKQAKTKRDAIKARALAAIDTDRAERAFRRHEATLSEARTARDVYGALGALRRMTAADTVWCQTRKRGMMIEAIWSK
jgi:hypothetical protein